MSVDISSLAYVLRKASEGSSHPLKHGHALELIAAALGYGSAAAYKAGVHNGEEHPALDQASYLVLRPEAIIERAVQLSSMAPPLTRLNMVLEAFVTCLPRARRFRNESELFTDITSLVDNTAVNDGAVSGAMADTNNDGIEDIQLPFDFSLGELPKPGDLHDIEIEGYITMARDRDRPYSGHKINVSALLTLGRVGRNSIKSPEVSVIRAQVDYNW